MVLNFSILKFDLKILYGIKNDKKLYYNIINSY